MSPSIYDRVKSVFVNAYPRFRLNRWEFVREHWRSPPGQLSFNFD